MEFHEWYNETIKKVAERRPEIRVGQAWFNELHAVRSDLADAVLGGIADPFYVDNNLPLFFAYVSTHWD